MQATRKEKGLGSGEQVPLPEEMMEAERMLHRLPLPIEIAADDQVWVSSITPMNGSDNSQESIQVVEHPVFEARRSRNMTRRIEHDAARQIHGPRLNRHTVIDS